MGNLKKCNKTVTLPFDPLIHSLQFSLNKQKCAGTEGYECPGGSVVKNPPANEGVMGSIPGLGRSPGGGNENRLQDSCLENRHGQRSLAGYSLWGHAVGYNLVTEHE